MCLSRTQTILILSLLVTGTDNNPMRLPNSVLEGHFMISSDNRGQGAGGGVVVFLTLLDATEHKNLFSIIQ